MSVLKIGRRSGLFGRRQAAQLSPSAKRARHALLHPRPQLAVPPLPNDFNSRRSNSLNRKALQLELGDSREMSGNWGVETGYRRRGLQPERLPLSIREAAVGGAPMSPDVARLVRGFFQAVDPVIQEWEKLTLREQDVLKLLTQGFLKKEIADRLKISEETVRTHTCHIYEKLHVNCRGDAIAKAMPLAAMQWMKPSIPTETHHSK